MPSSLQVVIDEHESARLFREADNLVLRYADGARSQDFVSLTMPVRRQDYVHQCLHPVFEMHLPEGYLLSIIRRYSAKLTGNDDLALLQLLAPAMRGRLHYQQLNNSTQPLHLDDLLLPRTGLFEELVERFALQSPVSGVQPKVLARLQDKATLRMDDYIVKAWGQEFPQLALNEFWCMEVFRSAGVPVPEFHLSADGSLFIMKRFDYEAGGRYLGFEDMCVLQARSRNDKYEGSYEQVVKTIKSFVSPRHLHESLQYFFKMMVLNQRLQNGDAHLKNFGLLYRNVQDIWLAPAYDVVSTTAYIRNDMSALTLMGSRKWWQREHLLKFGIQHCMLSAGQAQNLYQQCEQAMLQVADRINRQLASIKHQEQRDILQHLLQRLTR